MKSIKLIEGWEHYKGSLGGAWEVWREEKLPNSFYHLPWETVTLPHCYNSADTVDPDVKYYQGPGWYRHKLELRNPYPAGRTRLRFEGVGQKAAIYVFDELIHRHVGGYDEFVVDITEASERVEGNPLYHTCTPLAVEADNSRDLQTIPSDISDFNLYGGLYRNVHLMYVPQISLDRVHVKVSEVSEQQARIQVNARLYNPTNSAEKLKITTLLRNPEGQEIARSEEICEPWQGMRETALKVIQAPALWGPDHPALYTCTVILESVHGATEQTERFGVRYFEFMKKGPFTLNGKRLLLNGTQRHEDHAGVGAAMTEEMIRTEMLLIKEMGANFVRLGHYQQSALALDLCDELGLLVWEEIPWCRGGLGNQDYQKQSKDMLEAMIDQHYNHPSIILWGLGNENDWEGDFTYFDKDAIRSFMKELHDYAHEHDPQRVTAIRRCEFCKDIVDVYSPSIWAGWYRGIYTQYETYSRNEFENTDRFFHMEWGADNMAGRHVEKPYTGFRDITEGSTAEERDGDFLMSGGEPRVSVLGDWSETYFCDLVDWHLKSQETMEWLTGTAQWVFKDFSTPVRPDNPVPYVNQKGVVERDFTKKDAFYVFQSYWRKEPMVRIYGHSWNVRWGQLGEKKRVRVYSNCPEAELFVDGVSQGIKLRDSQNFPCAGLRWDIELSERVNQLKVVARKDDVVVMDEVSFEYQVEKWLSPNKLQLTATRLSENKVFLEVKTYDVNDVYCPDASNFVRFSVSGEGRLLDNLGTALGSRYVQLANGRAGIYVECREDAEGSAAVTSDGLKTAMVLLPKYGQLI
ncbi:glycoside hydrolase family 2 TIM barrel-domain containing protein [Paenibacillus alba]|uniref:Glycoside hydrolase family 2 TIM barrel-domain containing protein n=1 Tax=Paenibacillus alba TaxID=1197127 RepID=A0ABU6G4R3_9BACL|nr:glycoside hydrolase family 2 TIM barrel-domain containing protein [Paenibacillus alba]MEC0229161.1 glycoside hydrolase family 2 TIM barrel-domain containing protein [Paenibacillus alba]